MANFLYQSDLPDDLKLEGDLAIDTETKGLNIFGRDRLCVVQISDGNGDAHLVQFKDFEYADATNLINLLSDTETVKIFHYARFDVAALRIYLGVDIQNVFCTKIASKLARTYTDKHSLKELCREFLSLDLSKQQQSSNWAADLSEQQIDYAANDVLHLHKLKDALTEILVDEGRLDLAKGCFDALSLRVALDLEGWLDDDIFAH